MFDQNQKKLINLPVSATSAVKNINFDNSNKELLTERVRDLQRLGNEARAQKKDPTSRLSNRTEILRK
jgi:hypothetical protein